MPQTVNDRTIVNNALARVGASPLAALDEETPKARQVRAIYGDTIEPLLGGHDWSFNRVTYALDAIAATAENDYVASDRKFKSGWRYGFALPGTRLGPPWVVLRDPRMPKDPLRDFAIEGAALYCDVSAVWARVGVRAQPDVWPPYFRLAATIGVAAALAIPMAHDKDLAQRLLAEFQGTPQEGGRGGLIGKAIGQDRAGAPVSAPHWRDPLTDARFG
jgi:hypothetical protein